MALTTLTADNQSVAAGADNAPNCYVTLAEANAYFQDRLDVAAWDNANDTDKSKALVTATRILDTQPWVGYTTDDTQALAWPRSGFIPFDPRRGRNSIALGSLGLVPNQVKQATYELGYNLLNNDGLLDSGSSLDSISVGPISLDFSSFGASRIPSAVRNPIRFLLVPGAGQIWTRAN